jgi:1-acyl-sn-glycerol-3-phosphate acyltransferase
VLFWLTWYLTTAYFRLVLDLRARGLERIPRQGGTILISNHPSAMDAHLLGILIHRRCYILTSAANMRPPIVGWYLRRVGCYPIASGTDNSASMATAENLLRSGKMILILPEGGAGGNGSVRPFRAGFLRLASRTGAAVVPVAIAGTSDAMPTTAPRSLFEFLPRPATVLVQVMDPLTFPDLSDERAAFDQTLAWVQQLVADEVSELNRELVKRAGQSLA